MVRLAYNKYFYLTYPQFLHIAIAVQYTVEQECHNAQALTTVTTDEYEPYTLVVPIVL